MDSKVKIAQAIEDIFSKTIGGTSSIKLQLVEWICDFGVPCRVEEFKILYDNLLKEEEEKNANNNR